MIEAEDLTERLKELELQKHKKFRPIIICDAWYGFPIEESPRKERILAVSKQIYNFLKWRNDYLVQKKNNFDSSLSKVCVIGNQEDVDAVRIRVDAMIEKIKTTSSKILNSVYDSWECDYLPNVMLEDLILQMEKQVSTGDALSSVCYLSPDASHVLSAKCEPPNIVIVGMLVDRKIKPNRSKLRAESFIEMKIQQGSSTSTIELGNNNCIFRCSRLPLDALKVSDLQSNEPLNIDTVLEMMQRWWINVETKGSHEKSFIEAAARSMLTHRSRHPVRTIHGSAHSLG